MLTKSTSFAWQVVTRSLRLLSIAFPDRTKPSEIEELILRHEHLNGTCYGERRPLYAKIELYVNAGITPTNLLCALQRDPRFLRSNTEAVLRNVRMLKEFGFNDRQLHRFFVDAPWTLRTNSHDIASLLVYFHQTLRLPPKGIARLCEKDPLVASLHLRKTVLPCVEYFTQELKMPRHRFVEMVEKYPRLLRLSLDTRIRPIIAYFLQELQLPQERLVHHLRHYPALLGSSLPNGIRYRAEWLKRVTKSETYVLPSVCLRGLVLFQTRAIVLSGSYQLLLKRLNNDAFLVARILRRVPHILSYPSKVLDRQIRFIKERLERDVTELYHFPSILSMSLKDRIQPRVELMERIGFSQKRFSLFSLFSTNDIEFRHWLELKHGRADYSLLERERLVMQDMTHFKEEPLELSHMRQDHDPIFY